MSGLGQVLPSGQFVSLAEEGLLVRGRQVHVPVGHAHGHLIHEPSDRGEALQVQAVQVAATRALGLLLDLVHRLLQPVADEFGALGATALDIGEEKPGVAHVPGHERVHRQGEHIGPALGAEASFPLGDDIVDLVVDHQLHQVEGMVPGDGGAADGAVALEGLEFGGHADLILGAEPEFQQGFADGGGEIRVHFQGPIQLLRADKAEVHQQLSQRGGAKNLLFLLPRGNGDIPHLAPFLLHADLADGAPHPQLLPALLLLQGLGQLVFSNTAHLDQ